MDSRDGGTIIGSKMHLFFSWTSICQVLTNLRKLNFIIPFLEYEVIKDQPGDSYYVRAMFDRLPDPQAGPHQLSFRKDDILFIGKPSHGLLYLE